jgi:hypothetical protein
MSAGPTHPCNNVGERDVIAPNKAGLLRFVALAFLA